MRKIVQELLEGEAEENLNREYYERRGEEAKDGYRNGYKEGKIKTGEGKLIIQRP